jgi:hypothetical protein
MNTQENNKLIAEFWGMELGDDKTMYYDDAENLHPPTPINELKFHSSWDWMMPVVRRIVSDIELDLDYENEYREHLMDVVPFARIEDVYEAVVEFIKQYNNQ